MSPLPDAHEVQIRRGLPLDTPSIVRLRDDAASWLLGRGIVQWQPGEVSLADVVTWLRTGRVYVAEIAGALVGSVRVAWDDPSVWGEQPPEAGYVQALVSARSDEARGVGQLLLTHVERVIAMSGRPLARLSCLRGNVGLEAFYERAGYVEVGSRQFEDTPGWDPVTLLEKRLR